MLGNQRSCFTLDPDDGQSNLLIVNPERFCGQHFL
jgi:hypothetical protein